MMMMMTTTTTTTTLNVQVVGGALWYKHKHRQHRDVTALEWRRHWRYRGVPATKDTIIRNWNTSYHSSTAPQWARASSLLRFRGDTQDTAHWVGPLSTNDQPRRRDLYLTTRNTHKGQDVNATGGIRTRSPSKRVAVDPHLIPHGCNICTRLTLY